MNLEKRQINNTEKQEKVSHAREILLALENMGKYVFHGSPHRLDKLEPRQAYRGEGEKDGAPAVFATPYVDVAIFRALMDPRGVRGETKSGFKLSKGGTLHFSATKNLLDATKDRVRYVYVFKKDAFQKRNEMEALRFESIVPDEVVEVSGEDLMGEVEVI